MTERFIRFEDYDSTAIGRTLQRDPLPTRDVAHGDGDAFRLADSAVELQVFPATGVARVTTPDARVELFRLAGYSVNDQPPRVVFDQGNTEQRTRLAVRDDGKVSFMPVLTATEASTTAVPAGDAPKSGADVSDPAERPTTSDNTTPEANENLSQTLRGRLGRDPWFTSDAETPIAGFPLAVNDETSGKTTWHKVVTFGHPAEQLRDAHRAGQIRKGRLVDVTGTIVVQEEPTARGGVRKTEQFHATTIKRIRASKPKP
jgi:hypothetical protein